jgi:hypothetical protein
MWEGWSSSPSARRTRWRRRAVDLSSTKILNSDRVKCQHTGFSGSAQMLTSTAHSQNVFSSSEKGQKHHAETNRCPGCAEPRLRRVRILGAVANAIENERTQNTGWRGRYERPRPSRRERQARPIRSLGESARTRRGAPRSAAAGSRERSAPGHIRQHRSRIERGQAAATAVGGGSGGSASSDKQQR